MSGSVSPGGITKGRDLQGDLELKAQVCVVGSGAGGAVVAKTLAEAGLDVVIVEEGGYTPPEIYSKYRPTETLRHMAREAGTTAALPLGDTPFIGIMAGRTVGGSSVLTGGVCFRIPEAITDGVEGLLVPPRDPEALAGAITRVATDAALRAGLARGAAAAGDRYDITATVRRIEAVYAAVSR